MFIAIGLVVVAIFFPPAWFAVVVYIAYLIVTKKARRMRVIMQEIRRVIVDSTEQVLVKHLYNQAAKGFASEHGASMSPYKNDPEDDCLFVELTVDGENYNVCFQRWMAGGTLLTVSPR